MKYFYVFVLLFGSLSQLYSANHEILLTGLVKTLHEATELPPVLCKEVDEYVGMHKVWEMELQTHEPCFVRDLSSEALAVVEQSGKITTFDKKNGNRVRSVRSRHVLEVVDTEVLSSQHVVLALKQGVLRIVNLNKKGDSSSFDIPDAYKFPAGLALLKKGEKSELVVGDNNGWRSSISIFTIDLSHQTWQREKYGMHGYPDCITALPDGNVRFTLCQDGVMRNSIYTLDRTIGKKECREMGEYTDFKMAPYGMVGDNILMYGIDSEEKPYPLIIRLIRNGKDLGIKVTGTKPERLIADVGQNVAIGFGGKLKVLDEDGQVLHEDSVGDDICDLKYMVSGNHNLLVAALMSHPNTKIVAWDVATLYDEEK